MRALLPLFHHPSPPTRSPFAPVRAGGGTVTPLLHEGFCPTAIKRAQTIMGDKKKQKIDAMGRFLLKLALRFSEIHTATGPPQGSFTACGGQPFPPAPSITHEASKAHKEPRSRQLLRTPAPALLAKEASGPSTGWKQIFCPSPFQGDSL